MANGYEQPRSPVRAMLSVNHPIRENFADNPAASQSAHAFACPECGASLRFGLQSAQAFHTFPPLAAAPSLHPSSHSSLPADFDGRVKEFQRTLVSRALEENNGVMTRAAKALGLKYTTFVAMARRLGVVTNGDDLERTATD